MKQNPNYKEKRNIGLDLLRILSMFMVLILHLLGKGGMLEKESNSQIYYLIYNFMEILCIVAVNCYVLISGYFLIKSEFKWKKVISLWKETLFYSLLVFGITTIIKKEFDVTLFIKSCLPIITKEYWFINIYLLMYILSPFINKVIFSLKKEELRKLIIILMIVFSIWNSILPKEYVFDNTSGYGIIWFICLYIISAYIRLYEEMKENRFNSLKCIITYICSAIIIMLLMILFNNISFNVLKENIRTRLLAYNNILVFIESIALFMFFKNLTVKNKKIIEIIKFVSPLTLAVYLIHEQYGARKMLYFDILHMSNCYNNNFSMFFILGYAVTIFIICIIIEYIRRISVNFIKRKYSNE